jgi:hypothetical protein
MSEPVTVREKLLAELENDYDGTCEEFINSGLMFGGDKEEWEGSMHVAAGYIWDALQASVDKDKQAFDRASAALMDFCIRGMEGHYEQRNKAS